MVRIIEREENEYGMYIPLSAFEQDGVRTVNALPEAEDAARWLDSLAPSALQDPAVREKLDGMLRPIAEETGYEPDDGYCLGYSILYTAEPGQNVNESAIRSDTRRVYANERMECLTETKLDENAENCTIFGTVRDGKVLSFANLNSDDGEVVEIGVETAEGEDGKGYASSNVAAITAYFLEKGRRVFYETEASNKASAAVAEKVGMTPRAVEYHYVCFLPED